MKHALPKLTFALDALHPALSSETLEYHHGKHHRGYVDKLNKLVADTDFEKLGLTELVERSEGGLFNNAAQHYNHSFYWRCIAPQGGDGPSGDLLTAIERDFGSAAELKRAFTAAAVSHFGSGWAWLVKDASGRLRVETTSDAGCPLTGGETPILTCDVWEHAYYVDYRNARPDYVDAFWKLVNWDFVNLAFERPADVEDEILGVASSTKRSG